MLNLNRRRKAVSLIELMISVSIFSMIMVIIVSTMVYYLRSEKTVLMTSKLQKEARSVEGLLGAAVVVAQATEVSSQNGLTNNRLAVVNPDGSRRIFELVTLDNSIETIHDNFLVEWRNPNATSVPGSVSALESAAVIIGRHCTPAIEAGKPFSSGDYQPVFRKVPGRRFAEVRLRFGDNDPSEDAACHGFTGPGWQSYVLVTSVTPRNT